MPSNTNAKYLLRAWFRFGANWFNIHSDCTIAAHGSD